jgi:hemerythrin
LALFDWNNSYSVGVQELDQQHKKLVATLNQLHQAMLSRQSREAIGTLLSELVNYTKSHFTDEEQYLARTQYPKLADQKRMHASLNKQVLEFVGRYERGEIALDIHLLDFLRKWLMEHILEEDKEYGPWLNKAGIR